MTEDIALICIHKQLLKAQTPHMIHHAVTRVMCAGSLHCTWFVIYKMLELWEYQQRNIGRKIQPCKFIFSIIVLYNDACTAHGQMFGLCLLKELFDDDSNVGSQIRCLKAVLWKLGSVYRVFLWKRIKWLCQLRRYFAIPGINNQCLKMFSLRNVVSKHLLCMKSDSVVNFT